MHARFVMPGMFCHARLALSCPACFVMPGTGITAPFGHNPLAICASQHL
jgi:hypothetical protein